MTRLVAQAGYTFVYPGSWRSIPLDDENEMRANIRQLIKRQVGTADRLANTRRLLIDEVVSTALKAKKSGASAFSLALELLPGIPFAAALVATDEKLDAPVVGEPAEFLKGRFAGADILEFGAGYFARRRTSSTRRVGDEDVRSLDVEYHTLYPGNEAILSLVLSAPLVPDDDLFTELFDAMVDSLRWMDAAEQD